MKPRKPLVSAVLVALLAVGPVLAQGAEEGKGTQAAASASAAASGASMPATAASTDGATSAAAGVGSMAPPSSAAPVAAAAGPVDGQTYAVRLRDLEQRVDELKEQIRRSHTRLSLLSDTVLSGGVAGSRADIQFQNDMSSAFRLTRALFVLDGAVQYNKSDDTGALGQQTQIPIFAGSIPPGDHTVQVLIQLQGNGFGVFSYLKGYKFEVRSTHSFTAVEGKTISLQVIGYEKGGVTTPLEERPAVRYFEKVSSGVQGGTAPAAAPAAAPPSPAGASTSFSVGGGN
jgi:hypothetical protein